MIVSIMTPPTRRRAAGVVSACAALSVIVAPTAQAFAPVFRAIAPAPYAGEMIPSPVCRGADEDDSPSDSDDSGNGGENGGSENGGSANGGQQQGGDEEQDEGGGGNGAPENFAQLDGSLALTGGPERLFAANCHDQPDYVGPGLTPGATAEVVDTLRDASRFCGWLPASVRVDCVAARFRAAARDLPNSGAYAPARAALLDAARKLDNIVDQNASRGTSRKVFAVTPPGGGAVVRSAPLREIPAARAASANAAALAVIQETQTVLLRSSENSRTRMLHYQDIAAALDSTKVLLRSS